MTGRRNLRLVAAGAALIAVCATGVGALSSSALYTDSATRDTGTLRAGTVVLGTSPTASWISASGVAGLTPGASAYDEVTVSNDGSLGLTYTATATLTGGAALAAAMPTEVRADPTACTAAGFASGTTVSTSSTFGTAGGMSITPTARPLAAGDSERLCVRVTYPATHGRSQQSLTAATTTVTFTATNS